jgi:hypothetical protein
MAKEHICIPCGHIGYPSSISNGSFIGELAVYILLIVVSSFTSWWLMVIGLIYSLMRTFSRKKACSLCKSEQIIPTDSPNGIELLNKKSANKD